MKQGILITVYKNYEHLEKIVSFFDTELFKIFIHIDKKSKLSINEINQFKKYNSVKLIVQKYKVNWGGFNHLKSILFLTEVALKNNDINYFHLITGHDFPIKSKNYFIDYFQNSDCEYIEYFEIPKIGAADDGNMDRIEYYNLYDFFNAKIGSQNVKIRKFIELQKRVGFKRKISSRIPKLYGGSTYWSLSRDCVSHVLDFTKKNSFLLNRFKYSLCAEEFYFQTIILNSKFADKVINDNLRYIDWVARNGNNPAILDETDYEKLISTNAIFARKFDYPQSIGLLDKIESLLLK